MLYSFFLSFFYSTFPPNSYPVLFRRIKREHQETLTECAEWSQFAFQLFVWKSVLR